MNISPTCMACMVGQIEKAIRLLSPEKEDLEIVQIQKRIMKKMIELNETRSPYYGQLIYKEIARELGKNDPYEEIKKLNNEMAISLIDKMENIIESAEDPLFVSIILAILGNTIDLGTPHSIDIKKEVEGFSIDKLVINDFARFKKDLQIAKTILIIGDNSGEIVFDRIMIEALIKEFPDKKFIYAVRGGPSINDATIKEAQIVGMTKIVEVVEGSASPGVILEQSSDKFREIFNEAELILSKGQGNFESLDDVKPKKANLYFLLKAKCQFVANYFRVPLYSLILAHQDRIK